MGMGMGMGMGGGLGGGGLFGQTPGMMGSNMLGGGMMGQQAMMSPLAGSTPGMMNGLGGVGMLGGLNGVGSGLDQLLGSAGNSLLMGRTSYGLGADVPASRLPPKTRCPVDFIMPRAPARSKEKPLVFKALPTSPSQPTPNSGAMRPSSVGSRSKTPKMGLSLPPGSIEGNTGMNGTPRLTPVTTSRAPTPVTSAPSGGLRLKEVSRDSGDRAAGPTQSPRPMSPEIVELPPPAALREVRADDSQQVIKPNLIRMVVTPAGRGGEGNVRRAPPAFIPRLDRPDYWCKPSREMFSMMNEAQLSRIENFEVGRYSLGSVRWEGLTDVRALDLDATVDIEFGKLTMYATSDRPPVGEGLNKKALVTLIVPPTPEMQRLGLSAQEISAKLADVTESFGAKFVSYEQEQWVFRVENFGPGQSPRPEPVEMLDVPPVEETAADRHSFMRPGFMRMGVPPPARKSDADDFRQDGDDPVPVYRGAGRALPSFIPKLDGIEYWCKPSREMLGMMTEEQLRQIQDFEVGRHGLGSIRWEGCTDVRALDLDATVDIQFGKLNMYPHGEKPPVGEGLNKKAVVSLIVPPTREMHQLGLSVQEISAQLAAISESFGATFVSYDMEKWVFLVENFGKPVSDKELRAEAKLKELAALLAPKARGVETMPTRS